MRTPLVSYIIPCYNVASFLKQCVTSLLEQTYSRFEIILVDDGSQDETPAICDSLAAEYDCIRVLHQKNKGLSGARNAGLDMAQGEYVQYIDGDDFWYDKQALEMLVSQLDETIDFVGFNCSYYYPQSNTYAAWTAFPNEIAKPQALQKTFPILLTHGITPMSACLKLIRRELLINNNLRFEEGIVAEDIPWFIRLLELNPKCCFLNVYFYAYRQNTLTSITRCNTNTSFNNLFYIVEREYTTAQQRPLTAPAKEALMSFLAYEYCILLGLVRDTDEKRKNIDRLRPLKGLLHYKQNPKVKLSAFVYHLTGFKGACLILNTYYHRHINKQ